VPRIIPVVDLRQGRVVQAIAGRRQAYQPIRSRLTGSIDPIEIARLLCDRTGATELYVADLDAILTRSPPSQAVCRLIETLPGRIWLDAGFSRVPITAATEGSPRYRPILALEQLSSPGSIISEILAAKPCPSPQGTDKYAAERPKLSSAIFSLDLYGESFWIAGQPAQPYSEQSLQYLLDQIHHAGCRTLIVLDLQRVGTQSGPSTVMLCRWIARRWPELELIAGGGIRDREDVMRLGDVGVAGVLVGTALHEGRLP
jgi:phosphoribosylformimino-5-aminoimidazole carboxamide ribotide isomerase